MEAQVFRLFCFLILLMLSAVDIKTLSVPDAGIALLLGASVIWLPSEDILSSLPLAAALWAAFALSALICSALKSSVPIGMGDIKLISVLILGMDMYSVLRMAAAAGLLSGIFAALLLALKKASPRSEIPFVPFITAAYAAVSVREISVLFWKL